MSDDTPRTRRPRYTGTHPRRFDEKYKERDPARHPETVARVVASGRTPAGSHRPILVDEVLGVLDPKPGEVVVDATLGHGGHAAALLARVRPGGRLIALDVDAAELRRTEHRMRSAGFGDDELVVVHSNFAGLPKALGALGIAGADAILADLGCSSMQLDDPARGFSYKLDGPLDLRMNAARGVPATALIAKSTEAQLTAMLEQNSDEPHAALIARAIVEARGHAPVATTSALARIVRSALATKRGRDVDERGTLARTFQALRMEVNDEASALDSFLRVLPSCLAPGGRVAVLTFHSGEDRRVKHAFQQGVSTGEYWKAARRPVRPKPQEVAGNPRASSAKLRWAIRADD